MNETVHNISDFLYAFLFSARNGRLFHQIIHEREMARCNQGSLRVTLSRMKKSGHVIRSPDGWVLTEKGRVHASRIRLFDYITSPFEKHFPHTTIIAFDIPERHKTIRDWLRNQIKIFGYIMLQRSLWRGPGPLPKEFTKRLSDLGIKENIKIFQVTK